jgi:hypothetical protein
MACQGLLQFLWRSCAEYKPDKWRVSSGLQSSACAEGRPWPCEAWWRSGRRDPRCYLLPTPDVTPRDSTRPLLVLGCSEPKVTIGAPA